MRLFPSLNWSRLLLPAAIALVLPGTGEALTYSALPAKGRIGADRASGVS